MHSYTYQLIGVLILVVLLLSVCGGILDLQHDLVYLHVEHADENDESEDMFDHVWGVMSQFLKKCALNYVLISHTIPMSIYIAIEVLKQYQKSIIENDKHMNIINSSSTFDKQ